MKTKINNKSIIIGSRGSKLALWQANWVKTSLEDEFPDFDIEIKIIKTKGDKILDVPLAEVGGKGLFVKEIEFALLDQKIDIAVHSAKDMPSDIPDGLCIGAIPERENVCDVLISNKFKKISDLTSNTKIGTSSLRRASQLLSLNSKIKIVPLRGNVDTRIKKLDNDEIDAIILAAAGVKRLNLEHKISQYISIDTILPAVGQGALCIEIRDNDSFISNIVTVLNHEQTKITIICERAFLKKLEGNCQIPIAAYATIENSNISITGLVSDINGKTIIKQSLTGSIKEPEKIGNELAKMLLANGAKKILTELQSVK